MTRPSLSDSRCSAPVFSMVRPRGFVVVDLVEDASALGGERAVVHARRPAGIGRRDALLAAAALRVVADDQVAVHDVHLFPVIVHERLGRERARLDLQQPRAAALLRLLVQVARQDLLVEAQWIALRPLPAGVEVDLHELQMRLGLHPLLLQTSSVCMAWGVTVPSNAMKRLKSSRASARSREAKARSRSACVSNSSWASSTALPAFTGAVSFQSSGVCSVMARRPGQQVTRGTCTSRYLRIKALTSATSMS